MKIIFLLETINLLLKLRAYLTHKSNFHVDAALRKNYTNEALCKPPTSDEFEEKKKKKKPERKWRRKGRDGTRYFLSCRANLARWEENLCSLTSRYSAFVNFQQDEDVRGVYIYSVRHFVGFSSCNNFQFAPIYNYTLFCLICYSTLGPFTDCIPRRIL